VPSKKTLEQRVELEKKQRQISALERRLHYEQIAHTQTRTSLNASLKEIAGQVGMREFLFGLTHPDPSPPKWTLGTSKGKKSEHIPVLLASDFQWGEVVDPENMNGVNAYNIGIAQKRYQRLIERTVDISLNHLPNNTYKGIIYLRLGDMVSGDIHDDLNESNEAHAIEAVRSLVASEYWGLQQLALRFGKVHVISVPGNHGRTTKKPTSKRGAKDNYDTLSAWWLESMCQQNKAITFQTPPSGDAHFQIYGRKYFATHGDKIGSRGGAGFLGPVAPIMRGMKKVYDQQASQHQPFEKMFIGHFHVAYELDYGWSNGSLPGYSEFAKDGRMKPEEPVQWLLFFHRKYGVTSRWKVRVDNPPAIPQGHVVEPFEVEQ